MELVILIIALLFFSDIIKDMREKAKYNSYIDVSDIVQIEYDRVPEEEYENYRKYLQTEEWKDLRFATLWRDGFKCTRCNSTQHLQCHHTHYEGIHTMSFTIDQLETVCYGDGGCHERIHRGELPMKKDK